MQYMIWCVIVLTGIGIYFPTVYIRKTNRMIKLLEEIAANLRK